MDPSFLDLILTFLCPAPERCFFFFLELLVLLVPNAHLHEGLLGQLGGLEGDEAVQAGRGGAVGDVAYPAGGRLCSAGGRAADSHAGRRAHVDAAASGAQGPGRAV